MFSKIENSFISFEKEIERIALEKPCAPFSDFETNKEIQAKRIKKAREDFWFFDKTYFTAEMYSDGYSKPSSFHKELANICAAPGAHIVLAARKHGKTAILKKYFAWELITGRLTFGGSLSSTLPNARNILADIAALLKTDRVAFDFAPEFIELNADQFAFRLKGENQIRYFMAWSEGRSVRGATRMFNRPQKLLCDDLETRQSSLNQTNTEERIKFLSESFQSLSKKGTLIALGNNFDERCALNKLLREQNDGILPDSWSVRVFPAWKNSRPLWPERYPAQSEAELRVMLKPIDEAEWQADFQQNPTPPDGFIFKRLSPLPTWSALPDDARGVRWCDPNLSLKGRGDSTAILSLLYSVQTGFFYIADVACRSFSDSNKLLESYYSGANSRILALGFDGAVNQESTWTNHVKNYARAKAQPLKRIEYRRYRADDLAKNIQGDWNEGKILLPPDLCETKDGKEFLTQIFAFAGKKAGLRDDAPDALICAYELICERKIYKKAVSAPPSIIRDFYNF